MLGRFEAFTFAINEISQCWNKIAADEMKPYDLKASHALYLMALCKNSGGITAAKLCEICNKDKAEISRSVSIMKSKGLVRKENVSQNSYRAKLLLTDEGIKAAKQVEKRVILAVEAAGNGLSEPERKSFYHSLELIVKNLRKISKDGLPDSYTETAKSTTLQKREEY